jgi:acyl-CoA synthetase (AMP-forming)/AMP-acid ligase II
MSKGRYEVRHGKYVNLSVIQDPSPSAEIVRAVAGEQPWCTYEMLTSRLRAPQFANGYICFGERATTFKELDSMAYSTSVNLRRLGIQEGSHVAIIDTNSIEWVLVFLALMRIGAVAVPINTRLTTVEMLWQIRKSDCTHTVLRQAYLKRSLGDLITELRNLGGPSLIDISSASSYEESLEPSGALPPYRADPRKAAVILFTSGSTASPKGCVVTQAGMITDAAQHTQRLGINEHDVWFSAMPLFHGGGLIFGLTSALVSGCSLVGPEVFDAGHCLTMIEEHRATYQHGIDTMFLRELEHPDFRPDRLRSLRAAASTGSAEILKTLHDDMGINGIVSKWGITEGGGNLTLCHPQDPLEKRLYTVGYRYPGTEYRIVRPGSKVQLANGEVGEILTKGRRMIGYYNDDDATSDLFDDEGWLHSGDAGAFDVDGYLHYEGRIKEMLKVGGENVSIAEVESVVLQHEDVIAACVVSIPDRQLHEVPVVAVAIRGGVGGRSESILAFCRTRMAAFKVPQAVVEVALDELPLTGSGKFSRRDVRELVLKRMAGEAP